MKSFLNHLVTTSYLVLLVSCIIEITHELGFHYCGGQNIPTKPYCIEHYKKAYNVDEKYLDRLLDFLQEKN